MTAPVVGIFRTEKDALHAMEELKAAGWSKEQLSVIRRTREEVCRVESQTGTNASEGMVSGGLAGAVLGGAAGVLATAGLLFVPGIGPLLAAGPIATVLAGAAFGGSAGTLVGGLAGLGIPDHQAEQYRTLVEQDHVLVIATADAGNQALAERIVTACGSLEGAAAESAATEALALDRGRLRDEAAAPGSADRAVRLNRVREESAAAAGAASGAAAEDVRVLIGPRPGESTVDAPAPAQELIVPIPPAGE
ncbi:general stress protein [Paenibacillus pasadenensis]|uniref:general stress protein n=1 Tax=Paenibacillus pasadenensis TaxID=217090 RepID=UPI0003F9F073|nr:general stress protein [Paenibacillus pasadenensis]